MLDPTCGYHHFFASECHLGLAEWGSGLKRARGILDDAAEAFLHTTPQS